MAKIGNFNAILKYVRPANIIVLTDENVNSFYADYFDDLKANCRIEKMVFPAGEESKSLESVTKIWKYLIDNHFDKDTLIINFGGGMICDLGGFAASTYKRGIQYINIPTSLLAMIDASLGGKTAININNVKNCVGTFYFPVKQLEADLNLLNTLPRNELLSGFGEMIKYSLIFSYDFFRELSLISDFNAKIINPKWISDCVNYKNEIVKKDRFDTDTRHVLNFGHTIGHAIESYFAEIGKPMLHGIAVAHGLLIESYFSTIYSSLETSEYQYIKSLIKHHFKNFDFNDNIIDRMMFYMKNDKKNRNEKINFTLLEHIGNAKTDVYLRENEVKNGLFRFFETEIY